MVFLQSLCEAQKPPCSGEVCRAVWVKTDQESSKPWSVGGFKFQPPWKIWVKMEIIFFPKDIGVKNIKICELPKTQWCSLVTWFDTVECSCEEFTTNVEKEPFLYRISSLKKWPKRWRSLFFYPNRSIQHMSNHISYTFVYVHNM